MKASGEFQRYIIKLLLTDNTFFQTYGHHLHPQYFSENAFREQIVKQIKKAYEKLQQKPSPDFLRERVSRLNTNWKKECLEELAKIEEAEQSLLDREFDLLVQEFIFANSLHDVLDDSIDHLKSGEYDQIRQKVLGAFDVHAYRQDLGLDYFDTRARGEAMQERREGMICTMWPTLNRIMRGGLASGEIGLIMGKPKIGKTNVLLHMALGALIARKPVLYITLEVDDKLLSARLDSILTGRPIEEMEMLDVDAIERVERIGRMMKTPFQIKQFPTSQVTVEDIRSFMLTWENKRRCRTGLLIVDYADLIKPKKGYMREWEGVSETVRDLRGYGVERRFGVWTASQVKQMAWGKSTVESQDVGGESSKIASVDIVISVNQTLEEEELNLLRLWVADSRNTEARVGITLKQSNIFCLREIPQ